MKKPSLEDLEKEGSKPGSEEKIRKNFHSYKQRYQSRIHFLNDLERLYDLFTSGKLNFKDKAIVAGTLLYFINPIDLIPDFTPFIGFADDFALIAFTFKYLVSRSKKVLETEENHKTKKD